MKEFITIILLIGLSTKFVESCSGGGGESTATDTNTNTDTNGKPSDTNTDTNDGNHSKRHFHFSSCWFMLIVCSSKKLSKLAEIFITYFQQDRIKFEPNRTTFYYNYKSQHEKIQNA